MRIYHDEFQVDGVTPRELIAPQTLKKYAVFTLKLFLAYFFIFL